MATEVPILEVRDLTVSVGVPDGRRAVVVDHVNFKLDAGGTLGLVGESGSGKTMASLAIMGLLPPGARVDSGEVLLEGENLLAKSGREMQRIRGKRMTMVPQDPLTALNPSFTIRSQLSESLRLHRKLHDRELDAALVEALEQVHLSAAKERLDQYPHQLSGGMRQRVVSAIALAGRPQLLIADEPTSALDMTTQARYLVLLQELQRTTGIALLLVAHDLSLIRDVCENVLVMYASQVVEVGPVTHVLSTSRHPYTRALLGAIPRMGESVRLEVIEGQAPDVTDTLVGCHFAPRCRFVREICIRHEPELTARGPLVLARCFATAPGGWVET